MLSNRSHYLAYSIALGIALMLLFIVPTTLLANQAQTKQGRVTWVNDGDTLQVQGVGTVRLIGVDCPEKETTDRDWKYLRHGCSNQDRLRLSATSTLKRVIHLCKGKQVQVQVGGDKRDRYGRTLAYVWLADGRMLNQLLLEEGRAMVYRRFEFDHKKEFIRLESIARRRHVGIWQ
ncbi:MAG: thermonuclease family protein [Deltaproteobacteria bacterium]|nr:thermonuclease family protein [Deltaproteobacteria bacterium]